jgi:hypothetical protein
MIYYSKLRVVDVGKESYKTISIQNTGRKLNHP